MEEDIESGPNFVFTEGNEEEQENEPNFNFNGDGNEEESEEDKDVEEFLKELAQLNRKEKKQLEEPKQIKTNPTEKKQQHKKEKGKKKDDLRPQKKPITLVRQSKKDEPQKQEAKKKKYTKEQINEIFDKLSQKNDASEEVKKKYEQQEKEEAEKRRESTRKSLASVNKSIKKYIKDGFDMVKESNKAKNAAENQEEKQEESEEDKNKFSQKEIEQALINIGILEVEKPKPDQVCKNDKDSKSDRFRSIPEIESEMENWKIESEDSGDKFYSKEKAVEAISNALDSNENTPFNKSVKELLRYALANGKIVKKKEPRVEFEEEKEPPVVDEKHIQETTKTANKEIIKLIDDAFKPTEGTEEITRDQLFDALISLYIINSNKPELLPKYMVKKLNEWKGQEDETKYVRNNVITDIKGAIESTEGTKFVKMVKLAMSILTANGKGVKKNENTEEKPKEKSKFKPLVPGKRPIFPPPVQLKDDKPIGMSQQSKKLLEKTKHDSIMESIMKVIEEADKANSERNNERKMKEKEEKEKKKKKQEKMERERTRDVSGISPASLQYLKNMDAKKIEEKRNKHNVNAVNQNQNKESEEKKKLTDEERREREQKFEREREESIKEAAERGKKKIQVKEEPRLSYQDFLDAKPKLFGEVQKPKGWEKFIERKEAARKKEQERIEAEAKVKDAYSPARKSVSSLSSISTLKQNQQKNVHTTSFEFDDSDSADELI